MYIITGGLFVYLRGKSEDPEGNYLSKAIQISTKRYVSMETGD